MSDNTRHTLGLAGAANPLALPRGMVWADEFDWSPVAAERRWGTNGAQHLHIGVRQAGRPVTLRGDSNAGWIRRAALQALQALAAAPGQPYTLTLADGRALRVLFAPDDPIAAQPIGRPELPDDDTWYSATVRLIELGEDDEDDEGGDSEGGDSEGQDP